jgi:hypothetical protein
MNLSLNFAHAKTHLIRRGADKTEASGVVLAVGGGGAPIGRTHILTAVVPRPAAYHPIFAGNRPRWVCLRPT